MTKTWEQKKYEKILGKMTYEELVDWSESVYVRPINQADKKGVASAKILDVVVRNIIKEYIKKRFPREEK